MGFAKTGVPKKKKKWCGVARFACCRFHRKQKITWVRVGVCVRLSSLSSGTNLTLIPLPEEAEEAQEEQEVEMENEGVSSGIFTSSSRAMPSEQQTATGSGTSTAKAEIITGRTLTQDFAETTGGEEQRSAGEKEGRNQSVRKGHDRALRPRRTADGGSEAAAGQEEAGGLKVSRSRSPPSTHLPRPHHFHPPHPRHPRAEHGSAPLPLCGCPLSFALKHLPHAGVRDLRAKPDIELQISWGLMM